MKRYIKDPVTNKVYTAEVLAEVSAVDPFHWDTDIANLRAKAVELQSQIDEINTIQIPAKEAERADYFGQFPVEEAREEAREEVVEPVAEVVTEEV